MMDTKGTTQIKPGAHPGYFGRRGTIIYHFELTEKKKKSSALKNPSRQNELTGGGGANLRFPNRSALYFSEVTWVENNISLSMVSTLTE